MGIRPVYRSRAVWEQNYPDAAQGTEEEGNPLTGEQLAHAFNMFYSGDKRRSAGYAHMGMGLFLAKKILGLHGLRISLENTRSGVRVVIEK